MGLIYGAIALFAVAAMIGIYLITLVIQKRPRPRAVAVIHGLFAATALVLLIVHTMKTGADLVQIIVLFTIAALGGIVLFIRDLTGKVLPIWLAMLHALLAVSGFLFLLVYAFNK